MIFHSAQKLTKFDLRRPFLPQNEKSAILDTCANVHFLADFIFGEKWFHEFFWHFLHIWEQSTFCMNYSASLKRYYFLSENRILKTDFALVCGGDIIRASVLTGFVFSPSFVVIFFLLTMQIGNFIFKRPITLMKIALRSVFRWQLDYWAFLDKMPALMLLDSRPDS